MKPHRHLPALFAAATFFSTSVAPAATRIWDGGDTLNTNWNDSTNWSPNTAPVAGDNLVFPAGVPVADQATNNNFAANTIFAGLVFQTGGYSVAGNAFDLSTTGIALTHEENGSTTITPTIRLTGTGQMFDSGAKGLLSTGALNLNGNSLTLTGSGRIEIAGNIVNSIGVPSIGKSGDGSAVLGGFNNYSGSVTVSAGTLFADGFFSGTGTVLVANGAILAGTDAAGGITKSTTISGTLSPGTSSDTTKRMRFDTLSFSPTIGVTKRLQMNIRGTAAGDTHDQLRTDTSITLNSANLILDFGTYQPPLNTVFTLIDNRSPGAISGAFTGISENSESVVGKYLLRYSYTGGTGNDFTATVIALINEPPTLSIAGSFNTAENTPTPAIPFTVDDPDTAAASLTVTAVSGNTTLIPNANIVFGGSGASRNITITPAVDQIGSASIFLTVSDGDLTASKTITVTVFPPFQPVISVGGPGARFTSLTNPGGAFERVNQMDLTSDLSIEIAGDLTSETGQIPLIGKSGIQIYPVGEPRHISGGGGANGLIQICFADHITLDGSLGGTGTDRSLSIQTSSAKAIVKLADETSDTTIQNLVIHGGNNTLIDYGIRIEGEDLHRNTVRNNAISGVAVGISCVADNALLKGEDNHVTQNQMTDPAPDNIDLVGIEMVHQERPRITDNHIAGLITNNGHAVGIAVGLTIFLNEKESSNAIITGNVIEKFSLTDDNNFSVIGIGVASGGSGTTLIANNSISSLHGDPTGVDILAGIAGIAIYGQPGSTTKVYFNSVSVSGTSAGSSPSSASPVALLIGLGNPTVDLRNNVLANTSIFTGASNFILPGYAIGLSSLTATNLTSDHNVLFVPPGSPSGIAISGYDSISSTTHNSLGDWQTFRGEDGASLDNDPEFVSTSDLRPAIGSVLINSGTPIAGFPNDIQGVERNPVTPTIGAYELAVALPGSIESWRQLHFNTTNNSGDAANGFDFDHDGLVNLIEFAFGLNPKLPDIHLIPQPQRVVNDLVITFTPPAGVSGITYGAECSASLEVDDWDPLSDTGLAPEKKFVLPAGTESAKFMRLTISQP